LDDSEGAVLAKIRINEVRCAVLDEQVGRVRCVEELADLLLREWERVQIAGREWGGLFGQAPKQRCRILGAKRVDPFGGQRFKAWSFVGAHPAELGSALRGDNRILVLASREADKINRCVELRFAQQPGGRLTFAGELHLGRIGPASQQFLQGWGDGDSTSRYSA
jgi:hypothetical protein